MIERAHEILSGNSFFCTCCMDSNPFQHAVHIYDNNISSDLAWLRVHTEYVIAQDRSA
ncbi:hypothetical protein KSD_51350 [Ktedonobacter sp. SOSP1-85]|nr:hypothetical protein KSD_51350 [Ktedonobacter sp. SOSP1-85]